MFNFEKLHFINLDQSKELELYLETKLRKLEKYANSSKEYIVKSSICKEDGFLLKVIIFGPNKYVFKAEVNNDEAYATIDLIEEKLERQFLTAKNKCAS